VARGRRHGGVSKRRSRNVVNAALGIARYDKRMPSLAPLHAATSFVPRAERHDVDIAVRIEGPTVQPFSTRVKNISSSGMLLAKAGQLQVGDVVSVALPAKMPMLCVVARLRKGGGAGIKFENAALIDGFWA
jgi:hypothetical protein